MAGILRRFQKREKPVTDEVWELCAYSTQRRYDDQVEGLLNVRQQSVASSSCFICSVWLLVWLWYPELRLTRPPNAEQNDLHTCEVNQGPWSDMISTGIPWSRKTWSVNNLAVSATEDSFFFKAIRWANLKKNKTVKYGDYYSFAWGSRDMIVGNSDVKTCVK